MHIETDWQGNTQNCLLTHRHEGRLVYRVNVLDKLETLHHLFVEKACLLSEKICIDLPHFPTAQAMRASE